MQNAINMYALCVFHIHTVSFFTESLFKFSHMETWISICKYWLNSKRDFSKVGRRLLAGDILFRNYLLWGMDLKGRKTPIGLLLSKWINSLESSQFVSIKIQFALIPFDSVYTSVYCTLHTVDLCKILYLFWFISEWNVKMKNTSKCQTFYNCRHEILHEIQYSYAFNKSTIELRWDPNEVIAGCWCKC